MAGIKIDPEMLDIYLESLNKLMAGSETDGGNARLEVSGAGKTEDGLVLYNEEVNKLGDDLRELYETIRVNVDEEEQWKVFEVVEPINVKAGEIAPWFDESGGGIQYLLPNTVDELLDAGILRRIK